jgi:phosphatidylserine/phosphatidylglycerophosphate/cardiolipin synthase-like enzyme
VIKTTKTTQKRKETKAKGWGLLAWIVSGIGLCMLAMVVFVVAVNIDWQSVVSEENVNNLATVVSSLPTAIGDLATVDAPAAEVTEVPDAVDTPAADNGVELDSSEAVFQDFEISSATDWYELHFNNPQPGRNTGGIDQYLLAALDEAQTSIDIAAYELDLPRLVDSLVLAKKRGVKVRLVMDSDNLEEAELDPLKRAKITIVGDERNGLMHNKFIIIDSKIVFTGSWNLTYNDTYRNNNNQIRFMLPELVSNYQKEFDEMFVRKEFGPTSTSDTPYPLIQVGDTKIENYFSSEDGVAQHVQAELEKAQTSIYFLAFSFTNTDFGQVLIDKAGFGLDVRGIFDAQQIDAGADATWKQLRKAKLDVLEDGSQYKLHDKVFIIDSQTVIFGSYNFSKNAEKVNDENLLIIHDTQLANAFLQEFFKLWEQAKFATGQK